MLHIELNQDLAEEKERLSQALLLSLQEKINEVVPNIPEGVVEASYVTDDRMQELNKQFREKDKTTDVLSFSYLDDGEGETVGDVVISLEQAKRQQKDGLETELATLLTHGVLHALGYDHIDPKDAEVMFPLQDSIVTSIL